MYLSSAKRKRNYQKKYEYNLFNFLPQELLFLIFSHLNGTDLRSCACVCRYWNILISTLLIQDIVIICDITRSTSIYWSELLRDLNNIFSINDHIRFGFVGYTDHLPSFKPHQLISSYPLTYHSSALVQYLDAITLGKGKDYPEAVLDGIYSAINLNWRFNASKSLILICDSPPHGSQYSSQNGDYHDNFPEGCPCGLKESFLFSILSKFNISLYILYTHIDMEYTISIFQSYYPNIKSFLVDDFNFFPILNSICKQPDLNT